MVLWMIGLGLGDDGDITVKGLQAVKKAEHVYLEAYTSILPGLDRESLAAAYGVPEIIEADRELVESGCEEMLERAKKIGRVLSSCWRSSLRDDSHGPVAASTAARHTCEGHPQRIRDERSCILWVTALPFW